MLVRRHLDSVGSMTGRADLRLGITDVAPVVSCGSFSARAVVGEHLPITATVFREGHDAVAANVVLTPPGGDAAAQPLVRMTKFGPEPDRWAATTGSSYSRCRPVVSMSCARISRAPSTVAASSRAAW